MTPTSACPLAVTHRSPKIVPVRCSPMQVHVAELERLERRSFQSTIELQGGKRGTGCDRSTVQVECWTEETFH